MGVVVKKAIIHIGTHKTGSTTIQHFIAKNEMFLDRYGIYVPRTGRRDLEYADYQNIAWELSGHKKFDKNNGTLEELREEILQKKPDNILLSSEALGFQQDSLELPELIKEYFKGLGYEVHIITFVRPVYRYMDSMYSEMAKRGLCTYTFEEYVKKMMSLKRLKRYNYYKLFKGWKTVFGRVTVVPFEKVQWESSLEVEFFKNIPVDVDLEHVLQNSVASQNERVDAKYLEAVRITVKECESLDLNMKEINDIIVRISKLVKKHHWHHNVFSGLDNKTAISIFDNYEKNNSKFLKEIMGYEDGKCLFSETKEDFNFKKNIFSYKDFTNKEKVDIKAIISDIHSKSENIKEHKRKKTLCIVHIGMHKTGSSTIQHNLYTKEGKNFCYIDLGEKNQSFPIGSFFVHDPVRYHRDKVRRGMNREEIAIYNIKFDENFKKAVSSEEHDTFVLSAESISGMSKGSLTKMKAYLLRYFEEIKIVAYVRPPLSYVNSMFQQQIKSGRMKTFSIQNSAPRYRDKFEKFDKVFGAENVSLHLFDRTKLVGGDVFLDFIERNSLEVSTDRVIEANSSLSLEALSLLYVYYKYSDSFNNTENIKLINALSKFWSTKLRLGRKVLNPLLQDIKDDVKWIENRMKMKVMDDDYSDGSGYVINTEADLLRIAKKVIGDLEIVQKIDIEGLNSVVF